MDPNETREELFDLPGALAERLAAHDRGPARITPRVDAAVLALAAEHFAQRRERGGMGSARTRTAGTATRRGGGVRPSRRHRWALPAAIAATILIGIALVRPLNELGGDTPRLADDFDGSGSIDVLDAFALSRLRAADPAAISQRDIDRLMARIVALDATGGTL